MAGDKTPVFLLVSGEEVEEVQAVICCDHCDFETFSPYVLHEHLKSSCLGGDETDDDVASSQEQRQKRLSCQYCSKTFHKQFDLGQHLRTHTGERPYQCMICGRGFAQKSNVKKHLDTHKVWPIALYNLLPSSEKDVNDQDGLQSNVSQVPEKVAGSLQSSSLFECAYCDLKLHGYTTFKLHLAQHIKEKRFKCMQDGCGMLFEAVDQYLDHLNCHGPSNLSFSCQFDCGKSFPDLDSLGLHHLAHSIKKDTANPPGKARTTSKESKLSCSVCGATFATAKGLDYHLTVAKDHRHECPVCSKLFSSQRNVTLHVRSQHLLADEDSVVCSVCGKSFKSSFYLKMHVLIHTGEKPFQCEECSASFNRKDKLKRHRLVHSMERLPCKFTGCKKTFYRADKLKEHMLVHGSNAPSKCPSCPEVFSKPSELAYHQRVVHPTPNPLQCFKCKKRFKLEKERQLHHEQVHKITHTVTRE